MVKKETSLMTKMFYRDEKKTHECAVCDIELFKETKKYKVMEFENGLIKNLIKDNKKIVFKPFGEITTMEGSHIFLCRDHFETAWALKNSRTTWDEVIEKCKANKEVIIKTALDLATNEVKKEISDAICGGSLDL